MALPATVTRAGDLKIQARKLSDSEAQSGRSRKRNCRESNLSIPNTRLLGMARDLLLSDPKAAPAAFAGAVSAGALRDQHDR